MHPALAIAPILIPALAPGVNEEVPSAAGDEVTAEATDVNDRVKATVLLLGAEL